MYPRAIPVRKGDRVMIVRGEGKTGSASKVAKIDRKARKVYVEGFTYFKSDGTELQRPIDASNLVIINPDWSDIRRRKLLNRVNESIEWTDEVVSEFEAAEDEYETETLGPIEEAEGKAEETPDEGLEKIEDGTKIPEELVIRFLIHGICMWVAWFIFLLIMVSTNRWFQYRWKYN